MSLPWCKLYYLRGLYETGADFNIFLTIEFYKDDFMGAEKGNILMYNDMQNAFFFMYI